MSKLPTQWQYNVSDLETYRKAVQENTHACFELKNKNDKSIISKLKINFSPDGLYSSDSFKNIEAKFDFEIYFAPNFESDVLQDTDMDDWCSARLSSKIPYYTTKYKDRSQGETIATRGIILGTDLMEAAETQPLFRLLKSLDTNAFSADIFAELKEFMTFRTVPPEEAALKQDFTAAIHTLGELKGTSDARTAMEQAIEIAQEINALQPTQKIFFTLAQELVRQGYTDQAGELLEQTIFTSEYNAYYSEAHELMYQALKSVKTSSSDKERENIKASLPHLMESFDGHGDNDRVKFCCMVRDIATMAGAPKMFDALIKKQTGALDTQSLIEMVFIMSDELYKFNQQNKDKKLINAEEKTSANASPLLLLKQSREASGTEGNNVENTGQNEINATSVKGNEKILAYKQ